MQKKFLIGSILITLMMSGCYDSGCWLSTKCHEQRERERFIKLPFEQREQERQLNMQMWGTQTHHTIYNEPTPQELKKLKDEKEK